jgi:hypothetical protein
MMFHRAYFPGQRYLQQEVNIKKVRKTVSTFVPTSTVKIFFKNSSYFDPTPSFLTLDVNNHILISSFCCCGSLQLRSPPHRLCFFKKNSRRIPADDKCTGQRALALALSLSLRTTGGERPSARKFPQAQSRQCWLLLDTGSTS